MLFDGKTKHKYLEMNYAYSWNDEAYYGCGGYNNYWKFHTMGSCLKDYVFQKFPISVVTSVIKNKGVFELHNNQLYRYSDFDKFLHRIDFEYKHSRRYNFIRPYFYVNDSLNRFVISTVSGSDYLAHYASMLSFILTYFSYQTQIIVRRYKMQESKIALITGLGNNFVKSDDIVVIGSVDRIFDYFMTNVNCIFWVVLIIDTILLTNLRLVIISLISLVLNIVFGEILVQNWYIDFVHLEPRRLCIFQSLVH